MISIFINSKLDVILPTHSTHNDFRPNFFIVTRENFLDDDVRIAKTMSWIIFFFGFCFRFNRRIKLKTSLDLSLQIAFLHLNTTSKRWKWQFLRFKTITIFMKRSKFLWSLLHYIEVTPPDGVNFVL